MFLSKLFNHTRAKVMIALAGLTMVLGVGATISTVTSAQQNEVVETKASVSAVDYSSSYDGNDKFILRILSSGSGFATSNARMAVKIGNGSNYNGPFWSFPSNWMDVDSTNGNWNYVNLNNSNTWYYYAEIQVESRRTWLDSASNSFVMNRYGNDGGEDWGGCAPSAGGSSPYNALLNGGSANSLQVNSANQNTNFNASSSLGKVYKIRRMSKSTSGGAFTRDGCEVYDSSHSYTLPSPSNTPAGYEFAGWYSDSSCTEYVGTVGGSVTPKGDVTLYAKYVTAGGNGLVLTGDSAFMTATGKAAGLAWTKAGGTATSSSDVSMYEGYFPNLTLTANTTLKARAGDTWYDPASLELRTASTAEVSSTNIKILIAGTYDIYVDTDTNKYLITEHSSRTFTITYTRVFNGTVMNWWGTVNLSANLGALYSTLTPGSIYGFSFEGWYSDSSCSTGIESNQVTGSASVYAKYTSDSHNKIVYVALPSGDCYNNVTSGGSLFVYYQKSETDAERIKDAPVQKVNGVTSTNLYMASIPSDSTGFSFHCGLSEGNMQDGKRTYWTSLSEAESHNLYVCNSAADSGQDGHSRYGGTWADCYFQFQLASDSSFKNNLSTIDMSVPSNMSSGNDAEAVGVTPTSNYYFRVAVVINGAENYLTTPGTDTNTTACIQSGTNRLKSAAFASKINVYLKNNVIYLLDTGSIDGGGYLFISTTATTTDLTITVSFQNTSSVTVYPFSAAKLSNVSGVSRSSTFTFDSTRGMIKVPVYNLRGSLTPKAGEPYSLTITDGSSSTTVSVPQVTTKPVYYLSLFGTIESANSNRAQAASLAYDIDSAISSAGNSSVCNVTPALAKALATTYNTLAATPAIKTILEATKIETWGSTKPTYSDPEDVDLSTIYLRLCSIGDVTATYPPAGASFIPGPSNDQSPLTLTLWIVLGCGLLGLGAIGTAYFVSKKKKHQA